MSDLYPRFRTKAGRLTPYAFACGYIEQHDTGDICTTLWHEGGPCYHVSTHDHKNHVRLAWDVETTLTAARKVFARHKRDYHGSKAPCA